MHARARTHTHTHTYTHTHTHTHTHATEEGNNVKIKLEKRQDVTVIYRSRRRRYITFSGHRSFTLKQFLLLICLLGIVALRGDVE